MTRPRAQHTDGPIDAVRELHRRIAELDRDPRGSYRKRNTLSDELAAALPAVLAISPYPPLTHQPKI